MHKEELANNMSTNSGLEWPPAHHGITGVHLKTKSSSLKNASTHFEFFDKLVE